MRLFRSFCELGYFGRLAAFLPAVRSWLAALTWPLLLIALPGLWHNFGTLKHLVEGTEEMVFEVRFQSRSCPTMVVWSHNVEIFILPPSNHGQRYVAAPSKWVNF